MFEQDYIMRLIREMVRAVLKLLFNIDTESPTAELLEDQKSRETAEDLLRKIDEGNINEAENELSDIVEDGTMESLMIGLIFYSHLNEQDDEFLLSHDFNRDEVKEGLKRLTVKYGLNDMVDMFISED